MTLLCLIVRPFAVAVGIFTLLNLFVAVENPRLATTEIWLNLELGEPLQSLFAGVLGVTLLLPHSMGQSSSTRCVLSGLVCGFAVLVAVSAIGFYREMDAGRFWSDFPVPLSLFIFLILAVEFSRLWWWTPKSPRLPAPARIFMTVGAVCGALLLVTLTHVVTFGKTDFRRRADAAVIFGAKVEPDGTPCAALRDRLDIGIQLYHEGFVDFLIMTGGRDAHGTVEPAVMTAYAIARDVPPEQIFRDDEGVNTLASARNCRAIASAVGFRDLLAVTQYFHCARVKMLFERQGLTCYTVPTSSSLNRWENDAGPVRLAREKFFLLREIFAFPYYFLFHRT